MRRALSPILLAIVATLLLAAPAAAEPEMHLTPVGRVPFPTREYVLDLGSDAALLRGRVHVSENGNDVGPVAVRPLAASSVIPGVVLAIDASDSMRGRPYASAVSAAQAFAAQRQSTQQLGILTFNSGVHVLERPSADGGDVSKILAGAPTLAYGTHIYDALARSLDLLRDANFATGAIILLSDGADVGSVSTFTDVVARAQRQHVRIFTVGLRSGAYDAGPLQDLARQTSGAYMEAASADELTTIYEALGHRLANDFLLRYRSAALPKSHVTMRLVVDGIGSATNDYTAPSSAARPFHRSLWRRFVLSPLATVVISLLLAALAAWFVVLIAQRRATVVGRIEQFLRGEPAAERLKRKGKAVGLTLASSPRAKGVLARIDRELDVAEIDMTASRLVALTAGGTFVVCIVLALISPILILLGLLTPFVARGWVRHKVKGVRDDFADQLPANLQVLASAMRAGHSFSGALAVVVENAHEPSRRELRRAVSDDQLGVLADEAIRRVAVRMASRDLQQVALLSELQRTAGGNAAEVLDTVVETIRERADVRRLVRTLTAQGRMARWILTAIPVFVALVLWLMQPALMRPLFFTTGGQMALVVAAMLVLSGSLIIQRIVDIEV